MADLADLARLRAHADQIRDGMRAKPPTQGRSLTYDERRARCPTGHLWPRFEPARG